MKIDSKVKGGLAWAGLFVILAVPSADLLFGKDKAPAANLAVTTDAASAKPALTIPATKTDPLETASVNTPAAKNVDAVNTYVGSGKKLPAYISDAEAAPAVKLAVPVTVKPPVEVAAISPALETPPVPLPRNARPKAPTWVASTPVAKPAAQQPLIINESDLAQREATLTQPDQPVERFPLSDGSDEASTNDQTVVTDDQLEEWDSGSLADYLASKGLLNDDAEQPQSAEDNSDFVFNDGPTRPRRPQNDFFLF